MTKNNKWFWKKLFVVTETLHPTVTLLKKKELSIKQIFDKKTKQIVLEDTVRCDRDASSDCYTVVQLGLSQTVYKKDPKNSFILFMCTEKKNKPRPLNSQPINRWRCQRFIV